MSPLAHSAVPIRRQYGGTCAGQRFRWMMSLFGDERKARGESLGSLEVQIQCFQTSHL